MSYIYLSDKETEISGTFYSINIRIKITQKVGMVARLHTEHQDREEDMARLSKTIF